MNTHEAMTTFVEVVRVGGFSKAARTLSMSTTAVSRHVAELEQALGVTLLRRTTRQISLTESGTRYHTRAATILEEIERLNAEVGASDTGPRGRLKITAPPGIGNDVIAPLAVDFVEAYPEIELDIDFTERNVDLVGEGFDAAIRSGPLASSSMIAHKIAELRYVLCASPGYIHDRGAPARAEDIGRHDCVHWRGSTESSIWTLVDPAGTEIRIPIQGRLWINNFATARDAALRGIGLAILPRRNVRNDLEAGTLVNVLPGHEVRSSVLSLVRPPTPFEPAKLRAFIDFMDSALRDRTG